MKLPAEIVGLNISMPFVCGVAGLARCRNASSVATVPDVPHA